MKSRLLLASIGLLALVFFSGCETVPDKPVAIQRTHATLAAPKDKVWPLLVAEIGLQYPMRAIEKDSGLISTDWVTLPAGFNNMYAPSWILPPRAFLATWGGLRMNMKVQAIETDAGKTDVVINCHYEAFETNVQKTWLVTASNGALENQILTKIETKLPAALAAKPVAKPAGVVPAKSTGDSLIELKKLFDAGVITKAEYEAKRAPLIQKL